MTKEITAYPLNKLVQLKGTPLLQREMALPDWTLNFTKHENQKTAGELYCSAEFTKGVHDELIFLSVLNIFLSIAAFLGNTLILVALHKESSLHSPSKLLYRNLAITDLCVGVIAEPLTVTYWISVVSGRWNICHNAILAVGWSGFALCSVSLFTLTAIGVDRLLALLLGLRYRQVITLKRLRITSIVFCVLLSLKSPLGKSIKYVCMYVCIYSFVGGSTFIWNFAITTWCQYIGTALCLFSTIFAYTKIFLTLRHNQIQVQSSVSQGQRSQAVPALNIARYRKAVYSALWVQITLVICYLPFGIAVVLISQTELTLSSYLAWQFTITLVYLNSSLNPLLYCWRIREVRQAVKETLRQLFGCLSS